MSLHIMPFLCIIKFSHVTHKPCIKKNPKHFNFGNLKPKLHHRSAISNKVCLFLTIERHMNATS